MGARVEIPQIIHRISQRHEPSPFFFFLAGFFFRNSNASYCKKIKILFKRRILPVLFFGFIALLIWPYYYYLIWGYVDFNVIAPKITPYLKGQPELNQITWFLVCLFTTELIALFVLPKGNTLIKKLIIPVLFLSTGFYLFNFSTATKNLENLFGIQLNTWYIHESLVAFGLYSLGYLLFEYIKTIQQTRSTIRILLFLVFFSIILLTYNLNSPYEEFVIIMKESSHGSSGLFLITAISGIFSILLLSSFIPFSKTIDFLGKNTLILFCTNGLFHSYLNLHIITKIPNLDNLFWVIGCGLGITILNILLSIPVVLIINKYIPQLVGKPS